MAAFGTDQVLLYDVDPWNKLGFGAPNFGRNVTTLNKPVARLVDEIGNLQLFITTHVDAMRRQPPSRNTIERMCKSINRVHTVLGGRMKDYSELRLEEGHSRPAPKAWNIHPVPYFVSTMMRNSWIGEYNDLIMTALANLMQHSDNNLALTVTREMATDVWQYFAEIKLLLGMELLQIPKADLVKDDFVFTSAHYDAYKPAEVTVRTEALDSPGAINSLPTEEDLAPLYRGYPSVQIIANLKKFPVGPVPGFTGESGQPVPDDQATPGSDGSLIGSPVT